MNNEDCNDRDALLATYLTVVLDVYSRKIVRVGARSDPVDSVDDRRLASGHRARTV